MPHGTNEHSKHKLHHLANCYYCHRYDIVASEFERCIGGRNYSSIGQKQESKNLRVFGKGCIFSKVERKGKANFTKLHLFSKSLGPQWLWNSHEPVSELTVYTSRSFSRSWAPRLWKRQHKQSYLPSWISWTHTPSPSASFSELSRLISWESSVQPAWSVRQGRAIVRSEGGCLPFSLSTASPS